MAQQHSCILVGGEKGGTGKSTVATNLATLFRLAGHETHLLDCDKQQSARRYAGRRAAAERQPTLTSTFADGDQLQVPIADLAEKYDRVVIDCGGQDSVELRACMIAPAVRLMIIPIQAGFFDLETLVKMDQLVRTSKVYNPNLTAKVLINRAPTNTQITAADEAAEFIKSELEHLGLFETRLHERVSYNYAAAKGLCVLEYETQTKRGSKASNEMLALYNEVTGHPYGG
jgi:chromosome partitioning protein